MMHQAIEAQIQEVLTAIRPTIQMHNGDIEFVRFQDDIVYIKMLGACIGCPISSYTIKLGIEEALKAKIPQVSQVVAVEE